MSARELSVAGITEYYVLDAPGDHKTRFRRRAKARPHPHLDVAMPKAVLDAERQLRECREKDAEAGAVVLKCRDDCDEVVVVERGRVAR
jgi:hypothetical protein